MYLQNLFFSFLTAYADYVMYFHLEKTNLVGDKYGSNNIFAQNVFLLLNVILCLCVVNVIMCVSIQVLFSWSGYGRARNVIYYVSSFCFCYKMDSMKMNILDFRFRISAAREMPQTVNEIHWENEIRRTVT